MRIHSHEVALARPAQAFRVHGLEQAERQHDGDGKAAGYSFSTSACMSPVARGRPETASPFLYLPDPGAEIYFLCPEVCPNLEGFTRPGQPLPRGGRRAVVRGARLRRGRGCPRRHPPDAQLPFYHSFTHRTNNLAVELADGPGAITPHRPCAGLLHQLDRRPTTPPSSSPGTQHRHWPPEDEDDHLPIAAITGSPLPPAASPACRGITPDSACRCAAPPTRRPHHYRAAPSPTRARRPSPRGRGQLVAEDPGAMGRTPSRPSSASRSWGRAG